MHYSCLLRCRSSTLLSPYLTSARSEQHTKQQSRFCFSLRAHILHTERQIRRYFIVTLEAHEPARSCPATPNNTGPLCDEHYGSSRTKESCGCGPFSQLKEHRILPNKSSPPIWALRETHLSLVGACILTSRAHTQEKALKFSFSLSLSSRIKKFKKWHEKRRSSFLRLLPFFLCQTDLQLLINSLPQLKARALLLRHYGVIMSLWQQSRTSERTVKAQLEEGRSGLHVCKKKEVGNLRLSKTKTMNITFFFFYPRLTITCRQTLSPYLAGVYRCLQGCVCVQLLSSKTDPSL